MTYFSKSSIHPLGLGLILNLGVWIAILFENVLNAAEIQFPSTVALSIPYVLGSYLTISALMLSRWQPVARILICMGIFATFVLITLALISRPSLAYFALTGLLASLLILFPSSSPSNPKISNKLLASLSISTLLTWLYLLLAPSSRSPLAYSALIVSALLCLGSLANSFHRLNCRKSAAVDTLIFCLAGVALYFKKDFSSILQFVAEIAVLIPFFAILHIFRTPRISIYLKSRFESLFYHPEGAVITSFFILCALATIVLYSPMSLTKAQSFIDVAFMAISAVCITGLSTLDIGTDFTGLGKLFLLLAIQIGGLGIMSLSSLAFFLLGDRLSLEQERAFTSVYGEKVKGHLRGTLKSVLKITFLSEFIGAVILSAEFFRLGATLPDALWKGIFVSITAFCNAGLTLDSQNLIPYSQSPVVLLSISLLIIAGGLSPGFIYAFGKTRKWSGLTIQHRLIAISTLILLAVGTLFFLAIEWDKIMSNLGFFDKLTNAFLFSSTARTAGFASFDPSHLQPATLLILVGLMFIGGSPGGTAGGIKTTTFAVLLLTSLATIRGRSDVPVFKRRLTTSAIHRALTVFMLFSSLTGLATLSLLATQDLPAFDCFFEAVSAISTVGLTTGITTELDAVGKIIVMSCMFVGRVGPLAILLYLVENQGKSQLKVPQEDVIVG